MIRKRNRKIFEINSLDMSSTNEMNISENNNSKIPTILNTIDEIKKHIKVNKDIISIPVEKIKTHNTYNNKTKKKNFQTSRTSNFFDRKNYNASQVLKSSQNLEINGILNGNQKSIKNIIYEEKHFIGKEKVIPLDLNLLILNEDKKVTKEIELFFKKYHIEYTKKNNIKNFAYTCAKRNGVKFELHLIDLKENAIFFKIKKINGENKDFLGISKNINKFFK